MSPSGGAWLAAGALLYAGLAVSSMRLKSATYDEPRHLVAGYTYLARGDYRLNPEHPPLAKTLAAAGLLGMDVSFRTDDVSWREAYQNKLSRQFMYQWNDGDRLLFRARLPMVALAALLVVAVGLWAARLAGACAGAVAAFLAALFPDLLAHGQLVTTDAAVALFLFLTVYAFWRVAERITPVRVALAGLALGAALATKVSAFALFPILAALAAVLAFAGPPLLLRARGREQALEAPRARLLALAAVLLAMGVIAWAVIWASYGFHRAPSRDPSAPALDWTIVPPGQPAADLLRAVHRAGLLPDPYVWGLLFRVAANQAGGEDTAGAFLHGDLSGTGWWWYFPATFAVKTPLPLIALAAAALALAARGERRTECFLWLPVGLFAAITIAQRLNIGHRYLLPVYPFLFVAAARVAARGFERGVERHGPWLRAALALLLAWYAAGTLRVHPHYLAYFNEAAGGPRNGYRWLVDSNLDWGQDLRGLADYLRASGAAGAKLSYFGTADPAYYGIQAERLPGFPPPAQITAGVNPGDLLAVSATNLQAVRLDQGRRLMRRLREQEPIATIGYSILIYRADFSWTPE